MGVYGAENVNSPIQTTDNSNQSFERTEYAVGAQSEAALLLHAAIGRVHESHGAMAKDANREFDKATDSIAAYAIFYWAARLNSHRNEASNDFHWKAVA
jgi:hypothetical protein